MEKDVYLQKEVLKLLAIFISTSVEVFKDILHLGEHQIDIFDLPLPVSFIVLLLP